MNTYLIRYWKPRKYDERKQYTVKHESMEGALAQEKSKVEDADSYSWCIDSEQITGQFDRLHANQQGQIVKG